MGLTGAGLNRFRERVDEVLLDVFPATLMIGGKRVEGSGPGGKAVATFENFGEQEDFRFPFRVPGAALVKPLRVGVSVDWILSPTQVLKLEVVEAPLRPHESSVSFTCKKRREA
jgi:hypothetical protein